MPNNLESQKLSIAQKFNIDVASGLFSGVFCAGLFNPWDRALYLSVKDHRPFLSKENFRNPYQGFSQAIVQRAFLGGIYYIAQGQLRSHLHPYLRYDLHMNEYVTQFCIGTCAGSTSGALTNSISAIKYQMWGKENVSFITTVRDMWLHRGIKPFINGTRATVARDMLFGSTYEVLRTVFREQLSVSHGKKSHFDFFCNSAAAGIATIASGPLNYVRNIQYGTQPNQKPPTIREALKNVWDESKSHTHQSLGRARFFQQQFRVGWGTARVTVGMAVGQQVFDVARSELAKIYSSHKK